MAKKVVVKTCEFIRRGDVNYTVYGIFLVPKCYMNLPKEDFAQELHTLFDKKESFLVAYKFGEANVKASLLLCDFKEVSGVEVKDTSDWFLQPMFDELEMETLDRRVDPMILFFGDKTRLKFRINYYLDLLERGYSEEEAMTTVF